MNMGNLGFGEIILIIFFALLVFGPKKLPELGKAAGTTLREFKKATKGILDDDDVETKSK
jgi:sec-independent protein translocase protein TatA